MFERLAAPRVFGLPPGVDFPQALVDGLLARCQGQPPEALARVELIVNTERMRRRIRAICVCVELYGSMLSDSTSGFG